MASWLEQQIAALQAQGFDVSPEALAAQIPQGYDAMPAQAPPPQAPPPAPPLSLWGGVKTGAARDGLVGGLVGTFANPMEQAPQGEANTYQAVTGILRNVGRAIGSAYGNPNYAQGARAIDQRGMAIEQQGMQNQIENQMGLERLRQGQVDLGFKYAGEQRAAEKDRRLTASAQAVVDAMRDHPGDPASILKAANVAFSHGDTELGTKLLEAARNAGKPPDAPPVKDFYTPDGRVDQRQWDGTQWVTMGSGPRFQDPQPRNPIAVEGPNGDPIYVDPEQAKGRKPARGSLDDGDIKTEKQLRGEFMDQSKDFQTVRDMFQTVKGAGTGDNQGVSDISLIFAFMKIVDPRSTVRDGEYATAQNSGSIPENVANLYNNVISGTKLLPEQRAKFVAEAGKIYESRRSQQKRTEDTYRKLASQYGVDASRVVLDLSPDGESTRVSGGSSSTASAPTGGKLIGHTSSGRPVYQMPDGSQQVDE